MKKNFDHTDKNGDLPRERQSVKEANRPVRPNINESQNSSYAIDYVREQLLDMFGYERTFNGGLRVFTTLDSAVQADAERAVEDQLVKIVVGVS